MTTKLRHFAIKRGNVGKLAKKFWLLFIAQITSLKHCCCVVPVLKLGKERHNLFPMKVSKLALFVPIKPGTWALDMVNGFALIHSFIFCTRGFLSSGSWVSARAYLSSHWAKGVVTPRRNHKALVISAKWNDFLRLEIGKCTITIMFIFIAATAGCQKPFQQ